MIMCIRAKVAAAISVSSDYIGITMFAVQMRDARMILENGSSIAGFTLVEDGGSRI